jgi:hypothetical protein
VLTSIVRTALMSRCTGHRVFQSIRRRWKTFANSFNAILFLSPAFDVRNTDVQGRSVRIPDAFLRAPVPSPGAYDESPLF